MSILIMFLRKVVEMAQHIRSLVIDTFRGVRNLEMTDLADINILTGDNNCGKTSVLEILKSTEMPESLKMWVSAIRNDKNVPVSLGYSYYEGFQDLFNIDDECKEIKYSIKRSDGEVTTVRVMGEENEESLTVREIDEIDGVNRDWGSDGNIENSDEMIVDVSKLKLSIYINNEKMQEVSVYDFQRKMNLAFNNKTTDYTEAIYISPTRHADGIVFLNKVLDTPDLYEEMLEVLREFDNGIISINVDNANEKYRRGNVYKILSKNHKKALPLNVYGDGLKKAILLMSAVISSQNGILLLDEFETAIHTSAMNHVFEWILKTCMKLNVQLFMTSHSEEAIDKVLKCCPDLQEHIKVFTLFQNKEKTVARGLISRKAIEAKDEMGLELR